MFNLYLLFLAGYFFYQENEYFGWNIHPQSPEELICDGICFVLFAIMFATLAIQKILHR